MRKIARRVIRFVRPRCPFDRSTVRVPGTLIQMRESSNAVSNPIVLRRSLLIERC